MNDDMNDTMNDTMNDRSPCRSAPPDTYNPNGSSESDSNIKNTQK